LLLISDEKKILPQLSFVILTRNPNRKGIFSTIDLLVLAAAFDIANIIYFFAILIRRSSARSLPLFLMAASSCYSSKDPFFTVVNYGRKMVYEFDCRRRMIARP
jgi:hypothetical protein